MSEARTLPLDPESEELLRHLQTDLRADVGEACSRTRGTRYREELQVLVTIQSGRIVGAKATPLPRRYRPSLLTP